MEALVSECQLVLFPQVNDQFINARMMSLDLKVGVEVEKGENGGITKDGICKAINIMMDDTIIGKEARMNQLKWRDFLLAPEVQESYTGGFIDKLRGLLN
ncbi:Anthocyanidin 3-O-glucoside 2''-O-glucosyltransferase [Bienertia sinuspersici]